MKIQALVPIGFVLLLAACSGGDDAPAGPTGKTWIIAPTATATEDMVEAAVNAAPGDTIEFECGFFDLKGTLQLSNTEAITIKGCGKDQTVLSFRQSVGQVGILAVNVRGMVIRDLTVADSDGNGIELRAVDHGTISHVRTFWSSGGGNQSTTPINKDNFDKGVMNVACTNPATLNPAVPENAGGDTSSPDYTVSDKAGRYGVYPVSSQNILIEYTESIGASDAGIYVGQTNNTIIRNSRAAFNVFGFEIENVNGGEYHDNIAECNTGGFLVYDLDGNLRQYGDKTRMYRNVSRMNNTYNFTEGGFVANVPPGSGMITLSYDRIDIYDNEFRDNNTGGIIHASYELFPEGAGRPTEKRIDYYTEGVHIFRNKFSNNGNLLPRATTADMQNQDVARLLPAVVGYKNQAACSQPANAAKCAAAGGSGQTATGYRGAHIVWDGLLDELDAECAYPKRTDGTDVPMDERGKPLHTNRDQPTCHYNAYKFKPDGDRARILPDWWASCVDEDNEFSTDSLTFSDFHGLKGANAAVAISNGTPPTPEQVQELEEFPSSFDLTPHRCVTAYGRNLDPLPPVVIPPFVRSASDPAASPELIKQLCEKALTPGQVNFDAAPVNCPLLSQYNLFSNPQDPTSAPNASGGDGAANIAGMPFVLNSKLFSDYSVKYRVLFMPRGTKAIYKDASTNGKNATIDFPTGTIIAKTFAFMNETTGQEDIVETRLLIKRINTATNDVRWDGFAYIWADEGGTRVARLARAGGSKSVSWNYHDADTNQVLTGSAPAYSIPNANQCLSCHSRFDVEPGTAPIGMKVRNLNRPYASESSRATGQSAHAIAGQNQIEYLCANGLMMGCPATRTMDATSKVITNLERLPKYNVPGSGGQVADSDADIEQRAKAYLEVNCQHCHNDQGFAASTGLYLAAADKVDLAYGMCKHPTATGAEGSNGRPVDIWPGDPTRSILEFRVGPTADTPAARMPPLARTVVHAEGHALIRKWIQDVTVVDTTKYPNSDACE
ncbi:MAG TPA: parallel beta-helix domain-containing protein [Verrucomicrobiae bacterium]|nr:parallel beta-helix domain-containing protein [Verrucomicrobiae bacterium]